MANKIVIKSIFNWTDDERKKCYSLNLRNTGDMRVMLWRIRNSKEGKNGFTKHHAVMLFNEDKVLLGWALVFRYKWINADRVTAYFYVRRTCRRHGYGKVLMRAVVKRFGPTVVEPWNAESNGFFKSFPYKYKAPSQKFENSHLVIEKVK